MDAAQRTKIETGVLNCLDECRSAEPYSRMSAFIEGLKANRDWTAEEIIELQTQVIRALLFRHGQQVNPVVIPPQTAAPPRQYWLGFSLLAVFLLLILVVMAATVFIGTNVVLNNQFRGLREQRQEAIKLLRQPPRLSPPVLAPPSEPIPPSEPPPPSP